MLYVVVNVFIVLVFCCRSCFLMLHGMFRASNREAPNLAPLLHQSSTFGTVVVAAVAVVVVVVVILFVLDAT